MSKRREDGSGTGNQKQRKLFDFGFGGRRELEDEDEGGVGGKEVCREFKMQWLKDDHVGQHIVTRALKTQFPFFT